MSDRADEYEHYNYDYEKDMHSGKSGKQRSKKEAAEHTNHHDPSGHTRKTAQKLVNNSANEKKASGGKWITVS